MVCDLSVNHHVSQWYSFIVLIFSSILLLLILGKGIVRIKQLLTFRYRSLTNLHSSEGAYNSIS